MEGSLLYNLADFFTLHIPITLPIPITLYIPITLLILYTLQISIPCIVLTLYIAYSLYLAYFYTYHIPLPSIFLYPAYFYALHISIHCIFIYLAYLFTFHICLPCIFQGAGAPGWRRRGCPVGSCWRWLPTTSRAKINTLLEVCNAFMPHVHCTLAQYNRENKFKQNATHLKNAWFWPKKARKKHFFKVLLYIHNYTTISKIFTILQFIISKTGNNSSIIFSLAPKYCFFCPFLFWFVLLMNCLKW